MQNIAGFVASALALMAFSLPTSAAPIYCAAQSTTRNFMGVDDSQVSACLAAGVGNIGQAAHLDPFLTSAAGTGWTNVGDDFNLQFTQISASGTWSFDSSAWSQYADLAIGFKFGTGNRPDEWFIYSLADLVSSGDWEFFNNFDSGGGLSHLELYARGERNSVPEPGTLGLLGLGLAGMAAGMRRRRKNA
ncbi:MAG: PEP-CTERM sorting domain-containing protein [Steroidobacteraceae bacterium]